MNRTRTISPDIRDMMLAICRVFYDPGHTAVINVLIHHSHLSESQLVNLLEFDYAFLRTLLNKLKGDKIIEEKMQVSTDDTGKSTSKNTYYYINFKQALNTFMYRMECCFKKLEETQRRDINSGDYRCVQCGDTYRDMDIPSLLNAETGFINCATCEGVVETNEDTAKRHGAIEEMRRFNEKIRNPFIELFKRCNKQILTEDMIRPDLRENVAPSGDGQENGTSKPKTDEIKVNIFADATWNDNLGDNRGVKENPAWITSSVSNQFASNGLDESPVKSSSADGVTTSGDNVTQTMAPGRVPGAVSAASVLTGSEVMNFLMANEYCDEYCLKALQQLTRQLEYMPVRYDRLQVLCQGGLVKFVDVTDDILDRMSLEEVYRYRELGQMVQDFCYDSYDCCPIVRRDYY